MIKINPELCKGCYLCVEICPKSVYALSQIANKKGIYIPAPLNVENCIACHLCELSCPDQAILVEDEK
ncbi:MAG: ferredoxin family protein [Methanobrevibacter sp.]|jgi:2-oxoglutarate ferredoxin oxidoreductase subunit delta|nr:ferredoxin family protein [Methanobrevibacter sp.]